MKNKTFSVITIVSLISIIIISAIYILKPFQSIKTPDSITQDDSQKITCIQVLFIDESTENTHIDPSYFTDLETVDATRLTGPTRVGKFNDLEFVVHPPYEIAEFLLESKKIQTYLHLNADICLTNEIETAELYVASFDVTHEYCTNECLTEKYKFDFIIDKLTGEISIAPHDNRITSS